MTDAARSWSRTELVRLLHETIDHRIEARLPGGITAPRRGVIAEVLPDTRTVMVELAGSTTRVPVRGYPALPVTPAIGDEVVIDRSLDGWLMLSHVLGRDPSTALTADVRDWGVRADGVTDDTVTLQAAIDANPGTLLISGMCRITAPLRIEHSNVRLWGTRGKGGYHDPGASTAVDNEGRSGFVWDGPTYTSGAHDLVTMLVIQPLLAVDGPRLVGVVVEGLAFRGAGKAARCIVFRSGMDCRFDVWVEHAIWAAFEMGAVDPDLLGDWTDPQRNEIRVGFDQVATGDGVGVYLDWLPNATDANTCMNLFPLIGGYYHDSDGVVFGSTDNNLVELLITGNRVSAATHHGLRLKASNSPGGHARGNVFGEVAGTVYSEGTASGTYPAQRNIIHRYDKQSGLTADPVVEAGSTLWWTGNDDAGAQLTREGISFPATAQTSTNANMLDDYEEGTWTPTITCGTPGNLAVTYSVQLGRYVKVGRKVQLWVRIQTSTFSHTTASGNLRIAGVPFTPSTVTGMQWTGGGALRYTNASHTYPTPIVASADTSIYWALSASGQALPLAAITDVPTGVTVFAQCGIAYESG